MFSLIITLFPYMGELGNNASGTNLTTDADNLDTVREMGTAKPVFTNNYTTVKSQLGECVGL